MCRSCHWPSLIEKARLHLTAQPLWGRITPNGSTLVRTTRLDQFPSRDFIKMDIEGGEALALLGAQRILSQLRTTWFIELHGDQAKPCSDLLKANGYHVRNVGLNHIMAEPNGDTITSSVVGYKLRRSKFFAQVLH